MHKLNWGAASKQTALLKNKTMNQHKIKISSEEITSCKKQCIHEIIKAAQLYKLDITGKNELNDDVKYQINDLLKNVLNCVIDDITAMLQKNYH